MLDLGRLRILRMVDVVAVEVLGDDPLRLRLHPRGDERGQVAERIPVQDELLAQEPHGVRGRHSDGGQLVIRGVVEQERVP